ncbi:alpha-(1,3)-fucosyltransferase C-like [Physella acuta]|uniref:alpha-(1,3)-fucosyltransferase C-like n=1 Tax=Physella acuta TaxID=109671 RepID=UPI0027DC0F7C|nr:alpha-(1,3)-fucosyltransferase C-like [Physella acuta]
MLNKFKQLLLLIIIVSVIFTTLKYALYGSDDIGYTYVQKEVMNSSKNSPMSLNLNSNLCQINISHLCQKQVSTKPINTTISLEKSKNNYIEIETDNLTVKNVSKVYTHVLTEFTPAIAVPSSTINITKLVSHDPYSNTTKTDPHDPYSNITKLDPHDPYSKIKEKLLSGSPISVHVINLSSWLLPYLKNAPACCHGDCVFDQDNITDGTDVVVIVGFHLTESQRPVRRWPGQLYLLLDKEPPMNLPSYLWDDRSSLRYAFNFTAHYSVDADIFWPYHMLKRVKNTNNLNYYEIAKSKKKTAVWFVSHCHSKSKREDYVKEMQKYIDVDIFGRCGNDSVCPTGSSPDCLLQVLNQYRFHLSFENSMCKDYISEKLFKVFTPKTHIVPVVRGGADYEKSIPSHLFINANHFHTAKDLALYLKSLVADEVKYSDMLRDIDEYVFTAIPNIFCTICQKLKSFKLKSKFYDIKKWLNEQCYEPKEFT